MEIQAYGVRTILKRLYWGKFALVALALVLSIGPAFGCSGENYRRTMSVIDYSLSVSYELAATGDFNLLMSRMREISAFLRKAQEIRDENCEIRRLSRGIKQ